jgi:hypothetical protein
LINKSVLILKIYLCYHLILLKKPTSNKNYHGSNHICLL